MITEAFLQFLWRKEVSIGNDLRSTCGKRIYVIHPGVHNIHAGPDFLNARIRIDQLIWAGNVELHLNSTDWYKHGHHTDPSYNNVILHVVRDENGDTRNSLGRSIPTLKIVNYESLVSRYKLLRDKECWLACHHYFQRLPPSRLSLWLKQLQTERASIKTKRIQAIYRYCGHSWEETFYRALASGFGLPVNCLPFEMVAAGIPLQLLLQFQESQTTLEALLYGRAGFLEPGLTPGTYREEMQKLYAAHRNSLKGGPVPNHLWKFLRLRPASFPTLRISQFANLAHEQFPILDKVLATSTLHQIKTLLSARASIYWNTHYVFGKCSPSSIKQLGSQSIRTLIINVIIPFLTTFGRIRHHTYSQKRAAELLLELDAESNHIIRKWTKFGIKISTAQESQALIQLYNTYCKQNRCLDCQIGASYFESAGNEK